MSILEYIKIFRRIKKSGGAIVITKSKLDVVTATLHGNMTLIDLFNNTRGFEDVLNPPNLQPL